MVRHGGLDGTEDTPYTYAAVGRRIGMTTASACAGVFSRKDEKVLQSCSTVHNCEMLVRSSVILSSATGAWLSGENLWVAFGFLAQVMFFGRFFLQWIASERKQECVVPVGFWWLSVVGGAMLLAYAIHRRDPVFIAGQGCGMLIYLRNLYFIYAKHLKGKPTAGEAVPPAQ